MLETPKIVRAEAMPAAVIHVVIPRAEIQGVMGPAIGEVMSVVAAQEMTPAGPIFAHHLKMSREKFDFEVGVPVATPVTPSGRVVASTFPGGLVARAVYHGPYEELFSAWSKFGKWVAEQGVTPEPHLWEVYRVGPESGPDSAMWETELNQPLRETD